MRRAGWQLAPDKRVVGMIFPIYVLIPHLSAAGNVVVALTHFPRARRGAEAHALQAVVASKIRDSPIPTSLRVAGNCARRWISHSQRGPLSCSSINLSPAWT